MKPLNTNVTWEKLNDDVWVQAMLFLQVCPILSPVPALGASIPLLTHRESQRSFYQDLGSEAWQVHTRAALAAPLGLALAELQLPLP